MPDHGHAVPGAPGVHAAAASPLAFTFGSWYMWTAVGVAFPVLGLGLVAAAGLLAREAFETPRAFFVTHVATLGWITMTIMGAAAQMAPALLGARIRGERTVPWQYALFTVSVVAVVIGFERGDFTLATAGGVGVNLASWWFVLLMLRTLVSAGSGRGVVSPQIPVALACFILVLVWGTLLAANLRWAFWPWALVGRHGLVVHLALGLGGWFGLMVVGTFYRVVPLMHGARVASTRRSWAILVLAVLAIGGVPAGIALGSGETTRTCAILAAAALALFSGEIGHVLAHRRSRAPDLNVSHWRAVAVYSVVLAAVGVGWGLGWLRSAPPDRLGEGVVVLFLLGWVTQAIIGQVYKVTPFLMWYYRATIPDVVAIPHTPDLYAPRPGRIVLWLSNIGAAAMAAGVWRGETAVVRGGAVLFAVSAMLLAYVLAYRWIPAAARRELPFQWRWRIS